ncbi:MAG: hypothetical protein ACO1OB_15165, partial [Archangium sp.]
RMTLAGTLVGANTSNSTEPLSCASSSATGRDVYFHLNLATAQDVLIEAESDDFSPAVALLTACSGGTELGCDYSSSVELRRTNVPAGDYIIVVDSSTNSGAGDFDLTVTLSTATLPPMNDTCASAATLAPNATVMVNLNDAPRDYDHACAMNATGGDVVYTFTTTQAQSVRIVGDQSDTDVVIALRTTCADASSDLDCNDEDANYDNAEIFLANVPPGTYFVVFSAYSSFDVPGSAGLSLTLGPPILPPPNDSCAMPATLVPNTTVFTNAISSVADFNFTECFSTPAHDVMYTFTLASPQHVTIEASSGGNTEVMVELFTGADCTTATSTMAVSCTDEGYTGDPEFVVEENLAAGTYFVAVGTPDVEAQFGVSLIVAPVATAATNETCMTAATLVPNTTVNVEATTGVLDLEEPSCQSFAEHDVVYTFTTTMAQRVELTAFGNLDTDVAVSLRGTACDPGDELRCSNDSYLGGVEHLVVNNLPAGQYWVVLSADTTDAKMGVSLALAPPILPPANDNCSAPQVVTFTNNTATVALNLEGALINFPGEATCASGSDGVDVVYEVTIPANQNLTVRAVPLSNNVDPVLFARSPVCNTAMDEACEDDGSGGDSETLNVDNTTGAAKTVFVIVQEYHPGPEGRIDLTFTLQ